METKYSLAFEKWWFENYANEIIEVATVKISLEPFKKIAWAAWQAGVWNTIEKSGKYQFLGDKHI